MRAKQLLVALLGLATTIVAAGPLPAQTPTRDRELVFTPVPPCRVYDTRQFAPGVLRPGTVLKLSVYGCGVSFYTAAVAVNIVAVSPEGPGHLTAWAANQPKPGTSVINYSRGVTVANGVILEICDLFTCADNFLVESGVSATHVVVDLVGFFSPQLRPGAARYGAGGRNLYLCVNNTENVLFGLSHTVADWRQAELACPYGTWVCSPQERGNVACDTTRPDGTCDQIDHFGHCLDFPADSHRAWTRPRHAISSDLGPTVTGTTVDEQGVPVSHRFGSQLPVWCCSPF
jgi:hypothetical protein